MEGGPLKIHLKSNFGYGDFITNLSYCFNASIKYQTAVNATFHWNHSLDYLHDKNDPETIIERFWAVYNDLEHLENVSVSVKPDSNVKYRFINNLDHDNPYHGIWKTKRKLKNENYIVLWRSTFNTFFPGYDKDPIYNDWDNLIYFLNQNGYRIKEVTYRTPINEVLDIISNCTMGIGYDGMIHQLFKCYHKPILVFCKRKNLNRLLVPHAALEHSFENFVKNGLDYYLVESEIRLKQTNKSYKKWLYDYQDASKHKLFNQEI